MQDWKGRLTFCFKDLKDVTIQITTRGKLGITYPEGIGYKVILEHLKPLLVKADGTPAKITGVIKEPKGPLANEHTLKGELKRITEDLTFKLFRPPHPREVALEIGKPPRDVENLMHELAPETKWRTPSSDEIREAPERAARCMMLAALKRSAPSALTFINVSAEEKKNAEEYLTRFPELVPWVGRRWMFDNRRIPTEVADFVWPKEAKEVIGEKLYEEGEKRWREEYGSDWKRVKENFISMIRETRKREKRKQ